VAGTQACSAVRCTRQPFAVEDVRVSIVSAFGEYDARGKIELAKDINDRIGIDDITRELWAEHVVPVLKCAADIMSSEV
jgi:hypothetical protein